jgi:hypothetical protein
MLSVPTGSEDVDNVAIPLPLSGLEPSEVVPLLKVTAPLGVPPLPVTVAVRVTV